MVIDLDETLVHSSFKVSEKTEFGAAFLFWNLQLSFLSVTFWCKGKAVMYGLSVLCF